MTSASQECIPVLLDVTRWRSADILGEGLLSRPTACNRYSRWWWGQRRLFALTGQWSQAAVGQSLLPTPLGTVTCSYSLAVGDPGARLPLSF